MNIPASLLEEAKNISGLKTQTQAVVAALSEYIARRKGKQVLKLKGSMDKAYDYKAGRKKR